MSRKNRKFMSSSTRYGNFNGWCRKIKLKWIEDCFYDVIYFARENLPPRMFGVEIWADLVVDRRSID